MDQLHHQDGLADAGAAEHRRLAALRERRQQVDHLDAGREEVRRAGLGRERRRLAVDRPARRIGRQGRPAVADPAEDVNQPPEDRLANLNRDRAAGAARPIAASQPRRRLERDRARRRAVELRLDFGDDDPAVRILNFDRVVDRRRAMLEREIDHRAANRRHPAVELALTRNRRLLALGEAYAPFLHGGGLPRSAASRRKTIDPAMGMGPRFIDIFVI